MDMSLSRSARWLTSGGNRPAGKPREKAEGQTVEETVKDSPNSTIDLAELLARVENDRELMREVLMIFKEDFPRHLQALREAVKSLDSKNVARVAHALKGMLANVAATEAAAAAAQLERMGREGDATGFKEAFAAFESDAMKLLPQLDTYIAEVHK
jgi:two-component system sensor histidine kinase/response regulator